MLGGYKKCHEIINGYQRRFFKIHNQGCEFVFLEEPVSFKMCSIYPWFSEDVRADCDIYITIILLEKVKNLRGLPALLLTGSSE
jgi:hypothetical protein